MAYFSLDTYSGALRTYGKDLRKFYLYVLKNKGVLSKII